ncbi:MAG: hypothetical protein HY787_09505 [Deltaproteobacteria bacterium]|nr:hypothetical protein [Deltaproteobacteria bacterium]
MTVNLILLFLLFVHASVRQEADLKGIREKTQIVQRLGLTDLCLFTEASYTRHLSQADLHTPFQDSPMSLEHFPSGSIVAPPAVIRKIGTNSATKTQRRKEKI